MATYTRDEIDDAFTNFQEAAEVSAKSGDWRKWSECFTEDAEYVEHHYGKFQGRHAIYEWIQKTMSEPVNKDMRSFPIDWYVIDEQRGWVLCAVWNEMDDPGDGTLHREYNWTLLKYGGNGLFSYEEDMYNPAEFAVMVKGWLEAKQKAKG
jgi:hypothetical protein